MDSGVAILVVEDELLILDLIESALADGGYTVVACDSSAAAMARIEAGDVRFQAIITDIRIDAGPSGWVLAHRARELAPDICVVYITGDSAHQWAAEGVPGSVILVKPFAAAQLVSAVSVLLNAAGTP